MTGHVFKPGVDWVSLQNEYEAGIASVRQLARKHGISHTAINKRIKSHGWKLCPEKVSVPQIVETRLPDRPAPDDIEGKRQEILGHLANGATPNMAASLSDVTVETFGRWVEADSDFAKLVKRAQNHWAQRRIDNITGAADKGDWRAAAWGLERHPATRGEFGQVKSGEGAKIEIVFQGMPSPKAVTVDDTGTRAVIEND